MPKKVSNALTPLQVKNAKPGRHADGNGLQLLVKDTGARSWVFRFMLKGKSRDIGLGAAGSDGLSLAMARDVALALRLKVKAGVDPLAEREQAAADALVAAQAAKIAGITFKAVADTYLTTNEASWRNDKHRQQWRNTLATYVHPIIGEMPVADVSTAHVLLILEPLWQEKPETASRVRGRIETILDAAKARGYREGENPARWRGHIAQILPPRARLKRGHHKALPYDAVPAFTAQLRQRKAMAALALEFVILTATRTNEALAATWQEVDLAKAVWAIPASRMKAGKEHRVPLSPRAVEILKTLQPFGGETIFKSDSDGKLSTMAMSMLLRRMKVDCTVHGFRSAFRDWSAECTAYPHEVCEMALAHVIANKAEAAYRRGDLFEKRRRLMGDWASFCASVGGEASATVTPIRAQHDRIGGRIASRRSHCRKFLNRDNEAIDMSRYRWLRPLKCIESMEYYPAIKSKSHSELEALLFDAVERGDVRVMLNDEVVPKAHIAIYLGLYVRGKTKRSRKELPPDISLSYDDLRAVFDRPVVDSRKRGRPRKERAGWSEDRQLAFEMHEMLAGHPRVAQAKSASEAARILVGLGKVSGAGTPESRAKRLVREFRRYY